MTTAQLLLAAGWQPRGGLWQSPYTGNCFPEVDAGCAERMAAAGKPEQKTQLTTTEL